MFKYTICFIRRGDEILLLNRNRSPWMGSWNGVGGKLEPNETPEASVIREIYEETGISVGSVEDRGIVTWTADGVDLGGMYLFFSELPNDEVYDTPKVMDEGILDWKPIAWITHPENTGVASNLPKFLQFLISSPERYKHHCVFEDGYLVSVTSEKISCVSVKS